MVLAQETTGTVRGSVLDPSGAAIPNAKVQLSGPGLPANLTTESDATGAFRFVSVPPGPGYAVSVSASGFRNSRVANVNVEIGKATTVEVKLEVGQITETVEVAASAVLVDTQSSSSAVTVDKSFFDLLPKGRSFYDLINIAPGARNESKAGGYEVDGASGSENTYYLDGMEVTSIQQGTLSSQNRVPVEMVQQVQVKNGVMEAQYGGAMGGVINAVVRSGSNSFHGEAGFYYNNNSMRARPNPTLQISNTVPGRMTPEYFQNPMDDYQTWNPVFNLGGPLWKDKIFFFSGYAPTVTNTERTVKFLTGQTGTYDQRDAQQYLSNKIDFVPFSKLRVNMGWVWNPSRTTGSLPASNGTGSYTTNYASRGSRQSGNVLTYQADYIASSKLIFSFHGGYTVQNNNTNYGLTSDTYIYYNSSNVGMAGVPASLQRAAGAVSTSAGFTKYDKYPRHNYNLDGSYMFNLGGQHNIKAGWQMNQLANDVWTMSYPNGYYRYYWGSTYTCVTSQCSGRVAGTYGYYRLYIYGTVGNVSSNNQGLFVQDNWRVNKRLTLNLGLRTEHEFVPSFASDKSIPSKAITFSWGQKLSPRLGGAYDLFGDGKHRIYASFGWFYDIMKYELPRGSFGGDIYWTYYGKLDDPNLVNTLRGIPADPTKLPGFIEGINWRIPSNDPSNNLIDPNIKPMKQQMIDVGYDYSVSSTMVASARYTNRRLRRIIEDTGFMTPEGESYYIGNPSEGLLGDAAKWTAQWGPGIPLPPKPERKYDALELRLDKRFSSRYQFAASYTYSRLWGNYGGLASSDENGRTSPNVNRYYDEPWIAVMENGKYAYGNLASDRPHTFKLFGGYTQHSLLGDTTFSPIVSLYSGIPITTEANLISSTPAYPYGRGDMGRTPTFFNTDFNIMHEVAPFKAHEQMRFKFEFSVFNLFNTRTATNINSVLIHPDDGQIPESAFGNSYANIFKGFNTKALMAADNLRVNPLYGMASAFQSPRDCRLQLSFSF